MYGVALVAWVCMGVERCTLRELPILLRAHGDVKGNGPSRQCVKCCVRCNAQVLCEMQLVKSCVRSSPEVSCRGGGTFEMEPRLEPSLFLGLTLW